MRKNLKKTLLILFAVATMMAIFCFGASAKTVPASGKCGDNVTYTYNSTTCELVISGSGAMYYYYFDESPFYDSDIKSVVISDSVTTIGDSAFYYCDSLTSIIIPDSVISIGYKAFYNCKSLISVTIGNNVTTIGDHAFDYCERLTSVTIGNNVATIGDYAFSSCCSLTSVTIPNSVISIGNWAFYNCDSLTSVTIGNSVTSIGDDAFSSCDSLTSVTIGNSVTTIGDYAFYSCDSLTSVTIPDSVTSISDYAFAYCDSLTSVIIGDSITSIGDEAFYYCDNLSSVTIPDSVTSIGDEAFYGCNSFTSITIPYSITSIGDSAFSYCKSLQSITVDKDNKYFCTDENGVLFNKNKTELIQYPVGNKRTTYIIPDDVTTIGKSAFEYCLNLINITIPESVTTIKLNTFNGCYRLSNVYYTGTQSQWSEIMILGHNSYLVDATIYYDWCGSVHKKIVDLKAKNPTCTSTGLTDGKKCSVCGTVTVAQKSIAKLAHKETTVKGKPATCTTTGLTEGKKCSVCGTVTVKQTTIEKKAHTYTTTTTKATLSKNGKVVKNCSVCGTVSSTSTIYYPKTISLSATSYTYNGKVKTPSVTVKNSKGKKLKKDTDYTVKYESGRKSTGKYTVTVTFKGKYSGTKKLYFTITPKTTSKVTATQTTTSVTLKWSKVTGATGYRVFQKVNGKWKTLANTTKLTYTIKKLKAGTSYIFAVRPYTVDGKDTILASTFTQLKTATKCKTPTLKVTSSKKGAASLSWTNVAGESGYQVYYSTKKDGEYKKVKSYKTDVVTASKSKLTSGKTYYFKIRAYKKTDSGTVYGAYSAVKSVKIK